MTKIGRYTIDDDGNLYHANRLIIPAGRLFERDWMAEFFRSNPKADFKDFVECYKILKQKYGK